MEKSALVSSPLVCTDLECDFQLSRQSKEVTPANHNSCVRTRSRYMKTAQRAGKRPPAPHEGKRFSSVTASFQNQSKRELLDTQFASSSDWFIDHAEY